MMKKILYLLGILLMVSGSMAAQGTKTIKSKKIATKTVYETFVEDGMDEPVVESIERYDEAGALVELKEMNRKGEVRKWEKYAYDEEGKLVEEHFLDAKGRVTRNEKSIYKDDLIVEKHFYNTRNQLYKTKVYKYEYRE